MDLTGEYVINAPRQTVWAALNDPEILKQAISGCEEIERQSDTQLRARVTAKVGPVKARFAGQVTLSNLNPPESYTISGEGQGGAAGFAKGGADVRLEEVAEGTRLTYDVHATVGGKLAQLGGRLVASTAKKQADDFFKRFGTLVGAPAPETAAPTEAAVPTEAPAPSDPAPAPVPEPAAPARDGVRPAIWIGALIVVAAVMIIAAIW